jgi:hypothetical protein
MQYSFSLYNIDLVILNRSSNKILTYSKECGTIIVEVRMAKRPQKKTAKKKVHAKITDEEYLLTLIRFSERAISPQDNTVDDFFVEQIGRLNKKLKELRKKK